MIEDDLCTLLAGEIGVDVYARLIPIGMPECVMVQEIGGHSSTAGIRRTLVNDPSVFDPRGYLTVARDEVKKMVKHKIVNVLGSSGTL